MNKLQLAYARGFLKQAEATLKSANLSTFLSRPDVSNALLMGAGGAGIGGLTGYLRGYDRDPEKDRGLEQAKKLGLLGGGVGALAGGAIGARQMRTENQVRDALNRAGDTLKKIVQIDPPVVDSTTVSGGGSIGDLLSGFER